MNVSNASPSPTRYSHPDDLKGNIVLSSVGGRNKLIKRSTPLKPALVPEYEDEVDVSDKREEQEQYAHQAQLVQGESEDLVEDELKDFDPTAPVAKFDAQLELVEDWNKFQSELWPYLQRWGESRIAAAELSVRRVFFEIHALNARIRDELEQGAKDIEEQEAKHEQTRQYILDFQNQLARVGEMMARFGGQGLRVQ
ncbi:hypothetical protein BD324DRAFT_228563 [Kockovaella imperatae]|uniref:Uncharacterized protein n=1 Tax=Kockovaella imperatae TaxID=4999 RepID=A0A1Y1UNT5_9TREE|nr:hypothetical protein BD324DRAFT_228563 [Kockovaella imperatae]ORX39708.1 hypothetical protein BD324DRAFT_228563 [Kockovaella imperatae]